jgi:hypothetical protein
MKRRLMATDTEVQLFADDREIWRFRWDEVTRIVAYKRDLWTVDLICLDFFVASRQLTYQADEEMHGFRDMSDRMRLLFPSVGESWWPEVAFPAFVTNEKVLYDKPALTSPSL